MSTKQLDTEKFWSGVWSDMIIDKVIMRSMKIDGGLTHRRGMSENDITKFVLTMLTLTSTGLIRFQRPKILIK